MTNCFVYEHWRLDRDECFYVGMGRVKSRPYDMKKRNRHHKAIVAKAFREGFAVEVRIVATGLTWEEAATLEKDRILFWRNAGIDLANIAAGGEGCILLGSDNPQFGKPSPNRGKKMPEEQKNKIRLKMLGNKNQANCIYAKGKDHAFYGKRHSEESKKQIGKSLSKKSKIRDISAPQTGPTDAAQTSGLNLVQEG